MDNYKILLFLSMDNNPQNIISLYISLIDHGKKYYLNRLYCPMEGIGRMEGIDKSIR